MGFKLDNTGSDGEKYRSTVDLLKASAAAEAALR